MSELQMALILLIVILTIGAFLGLVILYLYMKFLSWLDKKLLKKE